MGINYRCVKQFCIPKCDEDGFEIPNEFGYVEVGSEWQQDARTNICGGEIHLDRVAGKGELGWIEISKETLTEAFAAIADALNKKIRKVKLNTLHMLGDADPNDGINPLWWKIVKYMDGEMAFVTESSLENDKYILLELENADRNKELFYMLELGSITGMHINDRESFEELWERGIYEPESAFCLDSENVILL